jgi:uncharacterized integral membrane protein
MTLLFGLLISVWIALAAIFSVQNARLVSLQFLGLQSIQMPLGILLAFAVLAGIWTALLLRPLWRWTRPKAKRPREVV